jgi:hypothetical protein
LMCPLRNRFEMVSDGWKGPQEIRMDKACVCLTR